MKILILICSILSLVGCGTGGGVKYNSEQVSQVKRVGIVSFTLLQEAILKDDPKLKPPPLPGGMKSWTPGINSFVKTSPHADQMLKQLKVELENQKQWKVMPIDQMKGNSAYVSLFNEKMHNWKNKIAPKEDTQFLLTEGVLDDETAKKLSQFERDQLMQSLSVDALAFIKVDVALVSPMGRLNGFGDRKPSATTYLVIYNKGAKDPIWQAWHEVKEPESSIALNEKGLDQEIMNSVSIASAKRSFNELLTTTTETK